MSAGAQLAAFDHIAAKLTMPMAIVTTRSGDDYDGCLVGFTTQCSIDPARFLVCLSKRNRTYDLAVRSSTLVVHMLHDSELDRELARLFGEETGYETDKLQQCEWAEGPERVPVLRSCDWFAGRIVDRVDLGDHVGFVLAIESGDARRANAPYLGYPTVKNLTAANPA